MTIASFGHVTMTLGLLIASVLAIWMSIAGHQLFDLLAERAADIPSSFDPLSDYLLTRDLHACNGNGLEDCLENNISYKQFNTVLRQSIAPTYLKQDTLKLFDLYDDYQVMHFQKSRLMSFVKFKLSTQKSFQWLKTNCVIPTWDYNMRIAMTSSNVNMVNVVGKDCLYLQRTMRGDFVWKQYVVGPMNEANHKHKLIEPGSVTNAGISLAVKSAIENSTLYVIDRVDRNTAIHPMAWVKTLASVGNLDQFINNHNGVSTTQFVHSEYGHSPHLWTDLHFGIIVCTVPHFHPEIIISGSVLELEDGQRVIISRVDATSLIFYPLLSMNNFEQYIKTKSLDFDWNCKLWKASVTRANAVALILTRNLRREHKISTLKVKRFVYIHTRCLHSSVYVVDEFV